MAGLGITAVTYLKDGETRHMSRRKVKGFPKVPTWVGNMSIDMNKEERMMGMWKSLKTGELTAHDILRSMVAQKKMAVKQVLGFISNGDLISVHDLYKVEEGVGVYCIFRTQYNVWRLLQVGSKTADEYLATGEDSWKGSYVPLLMRARHTDGHKKFEFLNPV